MASPKSTLPNDNKEDQDSAYNPGEQSYREGMGAGYTGAGVDQAESFANDPKNHDSAEDVRDAEDKGDWKSSYAGNKSRSGQKITAGNFKAIMKKRGPLAAIITAVLGGGIGAGVLFGPSLLLVQVQESFLNAFDSQNTSLTIRTNKILSNKLVEDNTTGACKLVQIACKFSRPSNKLLKNLEKNGVLAYDADGNQVKKDGLFQTTRPSKYTFNGKDISAKDFSSELRNNAAFRSAFHRAYNPRFVGFTDSVFQGIQKRFGFDTSNKSAEDGTKKTSERLNEASKGVNAVASEGAEEGAEGVLKKLLATKAGQVVSKVAKGGKGDTFGLIAGAVCTATDIPGMVISVVRAYQLVQVVNYSMQFLTAGSALKAGTITQEQLSALGGLLTTVVAGKTAMDSFGMRYAMFGDLTSSNKSYQKFIPGGSVSSSALGSFNQVTSSAAKQSTCDVATSPATGAAINVGLAVAGPETLGVSLGIAAANIGISWLASEFITQVGVPLIEKAVSGIDVKPLMQFFLGDLTQNLTGADVGDALASGASNMMGQTANAGGNMPLTVDQAVAYHQTTQDVNIAYAQEDRATLSPLDPTSPNTFVGSIVGKLVPYFANISSISSAFSSIASIPLNSLSTLISATTADAETAQQYSSCIDKTVQGSGVAAGPFCNIEYGIPTQWINLDVDTIVNDLLASGDIDHDTGEPIDKGSDDHTSSLFSWINFCTDGTTDNLKGCEIVDKKTAEYSLYIIDHRIQKSMDEADSDGSDGEDSTNQNGTDDSTDTSYNTDIQSLLNSALATATSTSTANPSTPATVVAPLSTYIAKPENAALNTSSTGTVASTYKPRINQNWYWTAA